MRVLVTGGAGYIGSHAVGQLLAAGHEPSVLDDLSRGHREAVPQGVPLEVCDVGDRPRVARLLVDRRIECVLHFAAYAYVHESVEKPLLYHANNAFGTLRLLEAMADAGVGRMVFSSTCATYGEPDRTPIAEDAAQQPINPYGWSKLFAEQMLRHQARALPGFAFAALRYFNVAGAAAAGTLGEDHDPETHLIPLIFEAALGKRKAIAIYGDDYPTPDGTCIRDYIHVEDLVDAHLVAMQQLADGATYFFNLGIGRGYSVREVVQAAQSIVDPFEVEIGTRRPGDPPTLYADASAIERAWGWRARVREIDPMIESAWRFARRHPRGYRSRHRS